MQNCIYQAWFGDFTSPVQAPGYPTEIVFLIWGFFYDKDMSMGFKFIENLKKLQSGSIFKLDFSEKKSKMLPEIWGSGHVRHCPAGKSWF